MRNPKISVVTVCYNAVTCLEQTILSVINQSYDNIEYIIIDGGSTDGSVDIIMKYSEKIAYWVSEPDKGIFNAMNKGLLAATGEWINFMNAGDVFVSPSTIDRIFKQSDNKTFDVLYGDTLSNLGKLKLRPFFSNSLKHIIPVPMGIVHQSIFVKTKAAKDIGFNELFSVSADYNMMMSLYKNGGMFKYVGFPVSVFDTNGYSFKNMNQQVIEEAIICGKVTSFHKIVNKIKYIYRRKMHS